MSWTDERIERLTILWTQGMTASQIADELGGVSRNAVIGKAHRLGLQSRPSPVKPNEENEDSVAPAAAEPARPAPAPPAAAARARGGGPAPPPPRAGRGRPGRPPPAPGARGPRRGGACRDGPAAATAAA